MSKEVVTLKDVARIAKVSTSTASRALTGDTRILPTTKERVILAARTLNYLPNRIASSLRSKSTGIIGIAINNLDNHTFRAIFDRVGVLADQYSLQVLLVTTNGDPVREAQFLDTARELQLDGVIVAGSGKNTDRINILLDKGFSVVITNRAVPGARAATVLPDFEKSSILATHHLISLGHSKIAFIGGLVKYQSGLENFSGYAQAMESAGLVFSEDLIIRGEYKRTFGDQAAKKIERLLLDNRITSVLLANHEATQELLLHLLGAGVSIPEDLSIICVEDSPLIEHWNPAISTVDVQPAKLADVAFEALLNQRAKIRQGEPMGDVISLIKINPRLIDRGSTQNLY